MFSPPPSPGANGWYISREGSSYGPYSVEQMGQMVADGLIYGETLVWQEGMAGWVPAAMVEGLSLPPTVRIVTEPRRAVRSKPRREPSPLIGFIALMLLAGGCVVWTVRAKDKPPQRGGQEQAEQKWYEGGTLHSATIDEWRSASPENRLATCAEFVAALWSKGRLREDMAAKIKTPDDLLVPVSALVTWRQQSN